MKCPAGLSNEAKKFYQKHSKRCEEEGSLTDATFETFVLLCRTYGYLADMQPEKSPKGMLEWNGTLKVYERLAVQFGVFSKKKSERTKDLADIINQGLQDA